MTKSIVRFAFGALVAGVLVMGPAQLRAEDVPSGRNSGSPSHVPARAADPQPALAEVLGIQFIDGSTSKVIVERGGKKYAVDLATRAIEEVGSQAPENASNLKPSNPQQPPSQQAAKTPPSSKPHGKIYEPGDDSIFSLPTGRRLDRHGFYVNFTHRFAFDPAFSGPARGGDLAGLDGYSLSSFGFRYGVTQKLSVSAFRSPTFIGRPIQWMAAYNFADEHEGLPFNGAVRISVEGQNDFSKNFTTNLEGILSRSLSSRGQFYVVPTLSIHNRPLPLPASVRGSAIPDVSCNIPHRCSNSFALGFAGAIDIRPSIALIAEVDPTLVGGRDLGIHRPAWAFGIQKRLWRHAFTLGFTNSPGVTVSQRSGTRAEYLGDPTADTPGGLFIGFDLTRQIY